MSSDDEPGQSIVILREDLRDSGSALPGPEEKTGTH
jgi:hypothetical protein